MTVINTNTAATITANALTKNERTMGQAMERLSTGQRINSAGDDAAGLAISSRMTSQINGLNMAVRNANDAISMVTTEDGALVEVTNMLQRMRELAVQAASGTMSTTDRAALHVEFKNLSGQIQNIGSNTQWNGSNILDGTPGSASFQVGANASQTVSHTFSQIKTAIASGSTPAVAATTDASGTDEELFTVTLDDGATFAAGDTLTFKVDGIFYSANIDAVDGDGDVSAITFHGSSTQITEAGTENYVVHTVTSDANGATTSPAGDVKVNISADNVFTFEGSLAHADADFTVLMTSALNDGTALANSTASTGLVAGAMFADISTVKGANSALHTIDHGIDRINTARSTSGATINRLEYAADNLANVSQNTSASRSRILDADYASETTELARTQIIQQAATAMLSQANQQAQSVLALLK